MRRGRISPNGRTSRPNRKASNASDCNNNDLLINLYEDRKRMHLPKNTSNIDFHNEYLIYKLCSNKQDISEVKVLILILMFIFIVCLKGHCPLINKYITDYGQSSISSEYYSTRMLTQRIDKSDQPFSGP